MSKGRPPAERSPQEKKALSYARDCRNFYGENDKASRRLIPRRKAIEARGSRRTAKHAMAVIETLPDAQADVVESTVRQDLRRVGGWRKSADEPLGRYIEVKKARLVRRIEWVGDEGDALWRDHLSKVQVTRSSGPH